MIIIIHIIIMFMIIMEKSSYKIVHLNHFKINSWNWSNMILIDLKTILISDSITIIPIITLFRTPQIDKSSNIQSSPLNQNSTEKRN